MPACRPDTYHQVTACADADFTGGSGTVACCPESPRGGTRVSSTGKVLIGLVVPFVAIVGLFPWYNRVSPEVLGFPFLYFWMFLWFVLTTVALFIVWRTDPRYQGRDD